MCRAIIDFQVYSHIILPLNEIKLMVVIKFCIKTQKLYYSCKEFFVFDLLTVYDLRQPDNYLPFRGRCFSLFVCLLMYSTKNI